MDLGDGRTVIVSSGPYQRTVVFRGARSPSPPPPAYRPPTPGRGPTTPSGAGAANGMPSSPAPSPRGSHTQIWPPQPGVAPRTPPRDPRDPGRSSGAPRPQPFQPGMPFQPQHPPMYPQQIMIPGPPPPPPVMMYPQTKPPLYTVIPPPPPPPPPPTPPVVPVQGAVLPHPPPPIQPVQAGVPPPPPRPDSSRQPRPPSPGHASTIDDEESDRGGSLSPPRRRSPSTSPTGDQGRRRHRHRRRGRSQRSPSPSGSPDRGQGRQRARQRSLSRSPPPRRDRSASIQTSSSYSSKSGGSYRSSTSLDSDMLSGLESLLERAERRKRARETERLQALIDRYDSEEQDAQDWAGVRSHAADTVAEAETAHRVTTESAQQAGAQRGQRNAEADGTNVDESETERPQRHVTFDRPSLEVLESRIGRPRSPSPPDQNPTRQDIRYGQSRVGRRHRKSSPNERIVERPIAPPSHMAESRVGKRHRPSPTRKHPVTRKRAHAFLDAGESRVGYRGHHGPQEQSRPGTLPKEAAATYISSQAAHGSDPTAGDSPLLNVPRALGPPSSTGATCGNGSEASEESSSARPQVRGNSHRDMRTRGRRDPSRHGHEHVRRQRNSPSPEK